MSFGQGGPYGPGGQPPSTPDWNALADESAAKNRRKRWLVIGGCALGVLAVGGIVTTAVLKSGGGSGKPGALPSPELPAQPDTPKPSFSDVTVPPPPNPRDYITDPKKDRAPLTPATLFPDKKLVAGDRAYPVAKTSSTKDCTSGAQGALVSVLSNNGCKQLLRATFSRDGIAVTVGIAVFGSKADADTVQKQAQPNLAALNGGGLPAFCQGVDCLATSNAYGRYAYFTIAGYTNGKDVRTSDDKARQAGRDGAAYAWHRIMQRGNDQAAKAAAAQSS